LTSKSKKIQDGGRPPYWKFQIAISLQWVIRSTSFLVLGWGFWGQRIERRYLRFDQIQDAGWRPSWKTSNGHISATGHPIHFVFYSMVGFLGMADRMALLPVGSYPRWPPTAILDQFKMVIYVQWFN